MRFFFCTHALLYDLPTRWPTLWGRPPHWQLNQIYLVKQSELYMLKVVVGNCLFLRARGWGIDHPVRKKWQIPGVRMVTGGIEPYIRPLRLPTAC